MSNIPELHLQPCDLQGQSVELTSLLGGVSSNAPELHLQPCDFAGQSVELTSLLEDVSSNTFDPMGTLPPALVSELQALKGGDPNTEITLTIYRGHCKMEVYL